MYPRRLVGPLIEAIPVTEQLRAAQVAELARNWHSWAPDPRGYQDSDCPEIHCLRNRLPSAILADAKRRAAALGVGADQVLIAAGVLSEESYLAALADWLVLGFAAVERFPRSACPLSDAYSSMRPGRKARSTCAADQACGRVQWADGAAFDRWARRSPETRASGAHHLSQRLRRYVERHGAAALRHHAASALRLLRR